MDCTDKNILRILGRDGRISFTALGAEIGLSRTAVQDRVTRLEKTGIIKGYKADYKEDQAGLIQAVLLINIAARPCDEALNWLASLDAVDKVMSISGELDAIAFCSILSPEELTELNDKIGASALISKSTASLVLSKRN